MLLQRVHWANVIPGGVLEPDLSPPKLIPLRVAIGQRGNQLLKRGTFYLP